MTNADRRDAAASEVVGAIILFAIFIGTLAILNLTAVPNAGKNAEQQHAGAVLTDLNGLQASGEGIAVPSAVGAGVARSIALAPAAPPGGDMMSFFLATPATAAGELSFVADYGNLTLTHTAGAATVTDIGNAAVRFPIGRILFDPHNYFASPGTDVLENGAVLTTAPGSETLRFAPSISVKVAGATTDVTVLARVLNGSSLDIGGTTSVRVAFTTESASISAPVAPNAGRVVLRLETSFGPAWSDYFNATSTSAGLVYGAGFTTTLARGAAPGGLDVVTWTIDGTGSGTDIRLTSGLSVFRVGLT
ncbi:MAG: hypothetical protein ACYDCK_10190 [Thermoplasmatota archaeon]